MAKGHYVENSTALMYEAQGGRDISDVWHVSKKDLLERQTLLAKGETMWPLPGNGTWYESFMTTEWRFHRVMIGAKVLQRRKARKTD